MAALLKTFVSTLLFLWALVFLADFASGKEADVTFVVKLAVEEGNVLKIVGNSSELGNGNIYDAPVMTRDSDDGWNLSVSLTVGEAYEVNLAVNNCTCLYMPYTFYLENETTIKLTDYFNCKPCLVPSPPPPSPSPPPPSPPPPSPSPPPPSPSPPPPSPSPPPPSPPPPSPSPPPPSPSPPPPNPPPPSGPHVHVMFVAHETVEGESAFKVVGNTSVLGNNSVHDAPVMNYSGDSFWDLTVILDAGETYEVSLAVEDCYCTAHQPYSFTVAATSYQIVNLTPHFNCTNCKDVSNKSFMFAITNGIVNMFPFLK